MTLPDGELFVIGIGNILLRDEGAGVRAAELVGRASHGRPDVLPPRTRVVDGGTLGLDLLPMLEDARAVVLIDAVNLHGAPGDVAVLRGDALHGTLANHVSPHQVGIGDLLATGRLAGTLPEQIALVGIQPGEIAVGLDLTDAVQAALPRAAPGCVNRLGAGPRARNRIRARGRRGRRCPRPAIGDDRLRHEAGSPGLSPACSAAVWPAFAPKLAMRPNRARVRFDHHEPTLRAERSGEGSEHRRESGPIDVVQHEVGEDQVERRLGHADRRRLAEEELDVAEAAQPAPRLREPAR